MVPFAHLHVHSEYSLLHSEGLICLSACLAGVIPRALAEGDMDGAYEL